jgi:tetratricopeptide (TPR) repeat protein
MTTVGVSYFVARRYEEAVTELRHAVAFNPSFLLAHMFLAEAYAQEGDYDGALAEGEFCGDRYWCMPRATGYAAALAGHTDKAMAVVTRLREFAAKQRVPPIYFAYVYAGLRRNDEAFSWLERAFEERHSDLIFLRVQPEWDPIRNDPRLADLIRRVGIPPLS